MKTKKIPYYFLLFLLTGGASLIVGFLSFGGMFALWPILPLAFASLALSIAYEGEIYFQNIKGALDKLFKRNHTENRLANEYLLKIFLTHFPDTIPDTKEKPCPQFFKDYKAQLELLHKFEHKRLTDESQAKKNRIQKTLRTMEKWFARQLFAVHNDKESHSTYENQVKEWLLAEEDRKKEREQSIKTRDASYIIYQLMGVFSGISALFMAFATTFLLGGAIELIPALAIIPAMALPFIIIPMALVAGAAYGLLVYNTITDMYNNDTIRKSLNRIRAHFVEKDGSILSGITMAILSAALFTLACALTLLTAGTWWTVAQSAKPIFEWMARLPVWVMGVITPLFTGLSTLFFDIQNTSETLEIIDEELRAKTNVFQRAINFLTERFKHLKTTENWLQMLNPFRILLVLTIAPLRIVLFIGHLISIGVTTDRVPGFPAFWMAFWGILSESFQDAHYFMDPHHQHAPEAAAELDEPNHHPHDEHPHDDHHQHNHHEHHHHKHDTPCKSHHFKEMLEERLSAKHSHNHDVDLPTRLLKLLFTPLYFLAACWAWLTSHFNEKPMTFERAWESQNGLEEAREISLPEQGLTDWNFEFAIYKIERHKEKQLYHPSMFAKPEVAAEKAQKFTQLQDKLRKHDKLTPIKEQIQEAASDTCFNRHRFFDNGSTASREFLDKLQNVFVH